MPDAIAFFLTWIAYGTWLPGDSRGWVKWHHGHQDPNPKLEKYSKSKLAEPVCHLDKRECQIVIEELHSFCHIRGWFLHAANCLMTQIHAVVTASGEKPEAVLSQLKAHCTRKFKESSQRLPTRNS